MSLKIYLFILLNLKALLVRKKERREVEGNKKNNEKLVILTNLAGVLAREKWCAPLELPIDN